MYDSREVTLEAGKLVWECEYDDSARLRIEDARGGLLALESFESGVRFGVDGNFFRASAVFDERGTLESAPGSFSWAREYPDQGVLLSQKWRKLDATSVECRTRLTARRPIQSPHLDWGVAPLVEPDFSRYAFAQSMTQMGYSFQKSGLTLWILSVPSGEDSGAAFAGCQGLVAENPDPGTLEFHLRLPPGYVAQTCRQYSLAAGEFVEIRAVVRLCAGAYYEHAESNEHYTTRAFLPPRYAYEKYIDLALENFLDERKYTACGNGILYHSAVDGDSRNPRIQYWTEGPSWGGGCDAENAWNLLLLARTMPERAEMLRSHAKRMLHGWLDNPRFRVPEGVYECTPGDMADAYVTTGWFPDCVWTIAQADLLLRLADIWRETHWAECLPEARRLARWLAGRISEDGAIPTIWQFPVEYPPELGNGWRPYFSRIARKDARASVLVGPQAVSGCFLSLALRHMAAAAPENAGCWNDAAAKLMKRALGVLKEPLCNFGGGECDYLVYRARSIDPTGIAYILRALSEDYEVTRNPEIPPLLRRYMDIMTSFVVHWDCREARLRPEEKTTLFPYGADIRLAGGVTHGNWMPVYKRGFGGRFNLLMNRNEIADGMFHVWRITGDERDLAHLLGFANWQTYFQFLNEVPGSPVSTRGSCPQNHFWTTDDGNWNNDFALTAFKWTGTYRTLLDAGLKG